MIQDSSNCARCGSQIRPQAKFCGKCGEAAEISCPECEVINPVGDRYCYDCGSQLRPSPWVLDPDYPDTQTGSSGPAPPPRPAAVGPVSCQRCHTANEPGAAYCYQCGLPLDEEAEPHLTTPPLDDATVSDYVSSRTRANWTIGLIGGVCLALLLHMAILNWQLDLVTDGGSTRAMLVAIEGVELAVGLQLLPLGGVHYSLPHVGAPCVEEPTNDRHARSALLARMGRWMVVHPDCEPVYALLGHGRDMAGKHCFVS